MSERTVLFPETRDFSALLTYHREWLPEMTGRNGAPSTPGVTPAMIYKNEIGPYCNVDMSQLAGPRSRSMVVTATREVLEAVRPRIVTPDDHLSFSIIGHAHTGRALVILEHGYISGSHWLAEIDPATIPAYPFAARDAATATLCAAIRESTGWVPWRKDLEAGAALYGYSATDRPGEGFKRLYKPAIIARVDAAGHVERLAPLPDEDGFTCAECGSSNAPAYVVTTLDANDPIGTRTEICTDCYAAITS